MSAGIPYVGAACHPQPRVANHTFFLLRMLEPLCPDELPACILLYYFRCLCLLKGRRCNSRAALPPLTRSDRGCLFLLRMIGGSSEQLQQHAYIDPHAPRKYGTRRCDKKSTVCRGFPPGKVKTNLHPQPYFPRAYSIVRCKLARKYEFLQKTSEPFSDPASSAISAC